MALIVYTQEELDKIHVQRQAIDGTFYGGPNDDLYIGEASGYLHKAKIVQGEITGTSLATVVSSIGDFSREEIISLLGSAKNLITKEELEKEVKELKCFNLAMSVAL